jgi:hypothetical protein
MISEESASYRLQCAAETLDNIKNDLHDLHECVNLNLGRKKPTIRFWDELNPTQTNSVDAVVSGFKSKILEEKLQNGERLDPSSAHLHLPANEAVKPALVAGHSSVLR